MRRIRNFNESVSAIVYHTTHVGSAIDILKSNSFRLPSNLGTQADQIGSDKFFYFSVSTIKWSGYNRGNFSDNQNAVIFVLDGRKFNQRYKGGPVDYWGPEFRGASATPEQRLQNDENEERIYSDDQIIPDASKYILEIHVYVPEDNIFDTTAPKINKYAREYGIARYFYEGKDKYKAFQLLDKRKSMPGSDLRSTLSRFVLAAKEVLKTGTTTDSRMRYAFMQIFEDKDLLADAGPKGHYAVSEISRPILNDIHIAKHDDTLAPWVGRLTQLMKKLKVRTVEDLIFEVAKRILV